MNTKTKSTIIELALFNIAWVVLVTFPAFWGLGLIILISQILLKRQFELFDNDSIAAIVLISLIGIAIDSTLSYTDVFLFKSKTLIPIWLGILWLNFAFTMCYALSWLSKNLILAVAFGGLFAPLSYYAGYRIGAVNFSFPTDTTLLIIGVIWAIALPIFLMIAKHIKVPARFRSSLSG